MHSFVLVAGLALALAGPPLLLRLVGVFGLDSTSWPARLSQWALAVAVMMLAFWLAGGVAPGLIELGLGAPALSSLHWGVGGALAILVAAGAMTVVLRLFGVVAGDRERFLKLAALPFPQRLFLVLTAAVTEEIFYRGFGVGFGETLLGPWGAAALSLAAFTLAHFRWRAAHLPNVLFAGAVLTVVFVHTGDLWACILAHGLVDALGLLVAPEMTRVRAIAG